MPSFIALRYHLLILLHGQLTNVIHHLTLPWGVVPIALANILLLQFSVHKLVVLLLILVFD